MNFIQIKEYLKTKLQELCEFHKKGLFPSPNFIIDIYTIIYDSCYKYQFSEINTLHTFFIKSAIKDSLNTLNKMEEKDVINHFCNDLDKLNYIIYYCNQTFSHIEKQFHNQLKGITLNKKAFNLLKNEFYIPFKEKLFQYLNILKDNDLDIKEENDDNIKKLLNYYYI